MSTAELALERMKTLPDDLQVEALHYIDYLRQQRSINAEDRACAELGATEMSRHYAPLDAIYDEE